METQNFARLFGNNTDITLDEKVRVIRELEKIGGLSFKINVDKEGWVATCKEIPGIIAANTNPNPSNEEIESQIRDAVFTAFDVKCDPPVIQSEYQSSFVYSFSN